MEDTLFTFPYTPTLPVSALPAVPGCFGPRSRRAGRTSISILASQWPNAMAPKHYFLLPSLAPENTPSQTSRFHQIISRSLQLWATAGRVTHLTEESSEIKEAGFLCSNLLNYYSPRNYKIPQVTMIKGNLIY